MPSSVAAVVFGPGDSVDSDVFSVSGALMMGVNAGAEDSSDVAGFDDGSESDGHLDSNSCFSRRMTFLLCLALAADLAGVEVDISVVMDDRCY